MQAQRFSKKYSHIIFIAGHYEGVDERFLNQFVDVPTKGDDGTPCVKINYSGNNKLNRLTDKSEPLPSKNSGDTYIAGGDMFIDKSHKEVNSKKTINFFNITSKKREISIIVLIGIIIAGIGVAWDITSDINIESPINPDDESSINTPIDNTKIDKKNSLEHQRIINYYDKGRPFSITWIRCGWSIEYDTNEKITEYKLSMVPKIIDAEGKESLIQFNSNFLFSAKALVTNPTEMKDITVENLPLQLINFDGDSPITVNLIKTFNEARELNADSVSLILEKTSIAPYSDITGENISTYSRNSTEILVENFVYLPYFDKWAEGSTPKEAICEN